MALADVLRERVSRRGRTAEVACGLLGTVTVEALPPRECAALGLRDGGRALLYAACRDLQTAGETLRREGRLFTPAEVTAYVSDEEAAAAARTVLALSGVTTDGDGASTKSAEVRLGDVQNNGTHLAVEAPSGEEIRLGDVQENEEVRHDGVRNNGPHFAGKAPSEGEFRLADVQENGDLTGKVRHEDVREKAVQKAEIRLGDVRKPDGTAEDGQVSHEFFSGDGSDRTAPILGGVSDFVPQNLALCEENDRFSAPLELSGNTGEVSGRGSNLHETESEVGEAVHETKSEFAAARRRGLHEMKSESAAARREGLHESKSEVEETLHEMKSELTTARRGGLHEKRSEVRETVHEAKSESAAARRRGLHESRSEVGETMHETKSDSAAERRRGLHESRSEVREAVHETKSESVERFAEGLLEGLRRAAAVR